MKTQTFFAVFALATAVIAAPIPNDPSSSSSTGDLSAIENILGSPFGNGNGDGNGNAAGNNDGNNASGNGANDGNGSGSGNDFGNKNGILSGNSGLSVARRNGGSSSSSSSACGTVDQIDNVLGSPFGNGNCDGNGNSAGNGDNGNASGNGSNDGNGSGSSNQFGNDNDILSGNSGLSIGKKVRKTPTETPETYVGNIIDAVVVPLEPGSSNSVIGSPSDNGDGNGNSNSAGNGDDGNASGNGSNDGNDSGSNNSIGNGNDILSDDCGVCTGSISIPVRDLPADALDLIPDQTVTSLNQDFSQVFSDGPTDLADAAAGALDGSDTSESFNGRRQVLTGLEDLLADDVVAYIP